jgi:hypothetical protein
MPDVRAQAITEITSAGLSRDGRHFVMRMTDRDGSDVGIALPMEIAFGLIGKLAEAHAKTWRCSGKSRLVAEVFELTAFQVGSVPNSDKTVLICGFGPGGAELGFWLSPHMTENLREALAAPAAEEHRRYLPN